MRWRSFASTFPQWTIGLLAGFIILQCLCWWEWFARELPPLQRYYLPTYFHSTGDATRLGAKTRIEPLFKTAPGRKRELILTSDVVSRRDENMSLQLSQSALEQGWTGIEQGAPIWDDSAAVEGFLRDGFYQNEGFWQVAAEPLLYSCAFLLASLISAFFIRAELVAEWKDIWTALAASRLPLDYRIDSPAHRIGIMSRIGFGWQPLKWLGKLPSRSVNFTLQTSRHADTKQDLISCSSNDPIPASVQVLPAASEEGLPQAGLGLQRSVEAYGGDSKKPAEGRRIFPGKAAIHGSDQKPKAWDESQWID